jgi:hypothetical protein
LQGPAASRIIHNPAYLEYSPTHTRSTKRVSWRVGILRHGVGEDFRYSGLNNVIETLRALQGNNRRLYGKHHMFKENQSLAAWRLRGSGSVQNTPTGVGIPSTAENSFWVHIL